METQSGVQDTEQLCGEVLSLASGAVQGDLSPSINALKDDFDVLVKAGLAYVVHWLRRDWIPIVTQTLGEMGSVDEGASGELMQRITPAIRDEFFHCAQLLQCLEVTLLQLAHLKTVREESFLSLQNLLVHLRDRAGDDITITNTDHRSTEFFGCNQRTNSG